MPSHLPSQWGSVLGEPHACLVVTRWLSTDLSVQVRHFPSDRSHRHLVQSTRSAPYTRSRVVPSTCSVRSLSYLSHLTLLFRRVMPFWDIALPVGGCLPSERRGELDEGAAEGLFTLHLEPRAGLAGRPICPATR